MLLAWLQTSPRRAVLRTHIGTRPRVAAIHRFTVSSRSGWKITPRWCYILPCKLAVVHLLVKVLECRMCHELYSKKNRNFYRSGMGPTACNIRCFLWPTCEGEGMAPLFTWLGAIFSLAGNGRGNDETLAKTGHSQNSKAGHTRVICVVFLISEGLSTLAVGSVWGVMPSTAAKSLHEFTSRSQSTNCLVSRTTQF